MSSGQTPGPEGSGRARRLHPRPWPVHPVAHGETPGALGRWGAGRLPQAVEFPRPAKVLTPTAEGASRALTQGEVLMAATIFGKSIDYSRPRVHNDEFLPFGLQPNNTAMTPNGEMYFNPSRFKEDFSLSTDSDKHWFIHEMVHVWQHQLGYPVMLRGAIRIGLDYEYELAADKRLGDYNMEAQGDLLADYFALKVLGVPEVMAMVKYRNSLPLYETVLQKFLANPSDTDNLP
jgi:hypothetical protein